MHLHVEQRDVLSTIGDSQTQEPSHGHELSYLITRWMSRDSEKSWRLLVDSVIRCNEMMVAKKIAQEVGIPFPGELNCCCVFFFGGGGGGVV